VVDECKKVPRSFPFHAAVDLSKVPNYARIAIPIDLGTIGDRCAGALPDAVADVVVARHYKRLGEFEGELRLIYENSREFNGVVSVYTDISKAIVDRGLAVLDVRSYRDLQ